MTVKKRIVNSVITSLSVVAFSIFVLLLNAWGDERYVLKEEARVEKIMEIDAQLSIKDTEILFAETDREKDKLKAIRAIYERQKEALKDQDAST